MYGLCACTQRALLSPVAGPYNISGVHSVQSLLDKFRLPLTVRLVYGPIPTKVPMHLVTSPSNNTRTHTFNGPLSGTTRVSRYEKGKTNLDFTDARDNEWQWHQLGHVKVCTSLQTDNHASTPPLCLYRPDALRAAQPTSSKH